MNDGILFTSPSGVYSYVTNAGGGESRIRLRVGRDGGLTHAPATGAFLLTHRLYCSIDGEPKKSKMTRVKL